MLPSLLPYPPLLDKLVCATNFKSDLSLMHVFQGIANEQMQVVWRFSRLWVRLFQPIVWLWRKRLVGGVALRGLCVSRIGKLLTDISFLI